MRLIDADKLEISMIAELTDEYGDAVPVYGVAAEDIDNAPTVSTPQWIPVTPMPRWKPVTPETMPESGVTVLLCCERRYRGKILYRYICDGQYVARHTEIVGYTADNLATEYDEETDEYYLLEGFYEYIKNWDEYVVISESVTHWMPMIQLPEVKLCEND